MTFHFPPQAGRFAEEKTHRSGGGFIIGSVAVSPGAGKGTVERDFGPGNRGGQVQEEPIREGWRESGKRRGSLKTRNRPGTPAGTE